MTGPVPRKHVWGPSRVNHGEAQCIHCQMTNREAWVFGECCPIEKDGVPVVASNVPLAALIATALVGTIQDMGRDGMHSGRLYMACNHYGVTLDQYEMIMSALVNTGLIRKSGHVYYYVPGAGRALDPDRAAPPGSRVLG